MSLSPTLARICMLREVVGDEEELRRGEARGDGLADVDVALDDDAVDRRVDVGVLEVLPRAIERDLRRLHVRARDVERRVGRSRTRCARRGRADISSRLRLYSRCACSELRLRALERWPARR